MTDKQFIETLKEIKKCCHEYTNCCKCKYLRNYGTHRGCVLIEIFDELTSRPDFWDIEEIERLLKE